MFELQDLSLDVSQLSPLKALEQAGILKLPEPRQTQTTVPLLLSVDGTLDGGGEGKKQVSLLKQQQQPNVKVAKQEVVSSRFRELSKELIRNGQLVTITDDSQGEVQYVNSDLSDPKIINAIMEQAMLDVEQTIKVEDGNISIDHQEPMVVGEKQLLIEMRSGEEEREKFIRGDQKRATLRNVNGPVCPFRSQQFPTANLLELHHSEAHSDSRTLSCLICLKSFNSASSLKKHRLSHQRQYTCPICHRTYERLAQLMIHMKHHDRKKYIQFGSNFHEVRVISSRNQKGQVVQEHYLLLLLSKEEQNNIETELATALHTETNPYGAMGETDLQSSPNMMTKKVENTTGKSEEFARNEENGQQSRDIDIEAAGEVIKSELNKAAETSETMAVSMEDNDNNESIGYKKVGSSACLDLDEVHLKGESSVAKVDMKKKMLYKCGHCKRVFFTRPALSRHLIKHTNTKPFQCEKCLKSFRDKTDLLHHYRTHTKPVQCPACYTTFSKSLYLRNHLEKGCPNHRSDDRIVVLEDMRCLCKVCDKVLKSKANAIRHLRIHDFQERSKLKQVIGDNVLESVSNLSQDVTDHYKPLESSIGFQCLLCGEEMRFKSSMMTHVRMHLNQRPFKCDQCPKSFFARHVLRKHQLNHTRPYKCPVCGKGFMRRYMMTKHFSKWHDLPEGAEDPMKDITELPNQKMIQCDICGKTMKQCHKKLMLYHIRLHKDVRPFMCDHCPKSFISLTARKKHSLTHTKPYVCQVCGTGFSRRYLLTKHFKSSCVLKVNKRNKPSGNSSLQNQSCSLVSRSTQSGLLGKEEHLEVQGNDTSVPEEISHSLSNGKRYFCEPCSKHFTVYDTFLRHMKTFSRPTSCKYCKQLFENKHVAIAHQRSCLGPAVSEMAGAHIKKDRSVGSGDWQERVKIMEEVTKTIETVSEVAKSADCKGNLLSSMPLRDNLEKNEDSDTPALNKTVEALKSKHGKYGCPQCERIFATPRGLKIHASSHVRLFKCEICDIEFKNIKALRSHHVQQHEKKDFEITSNHGEKSTGDIDCSDSNQTSCISDSDREDKTRNRDTPVLGDKLPSNEAETTCTLLSLARVSEDGEFKTSSDAWAEPNSEISELACIRKAPHLEKSEKNTKDVLPELKLMQLGTKGRPYRCQFCRKRFTEEENLEAHMVLSH